MCAPRIGGTKFDKQTCKSDILNPAVMQALKKTKQEVVAEFRSAEILEAARRVFARKGFEGASGDGYAGPQSPA